MANPHINTEERGNAIVITLVLLVILAGAGGTYFLAKNGTLKISGISSDSDVVDVSAADTGDASEEVSEDANPVIAKVDGKDIYRQDVIDMMNSVPPQLRQMPPEQLFPMVLEQMINNQIIDKKASKAGLENDKDVKEQLAKVKEQIIRTKFLENTLKDNLDEARVKEEYDAYVAAYKPEDEARASHILVTEEKAAKDIIKKLNAGGSFEELAKENSTDGSAQNGGDLGYFTKTEVVPEFADAAFALEVGKYTKAPVKSNFGFHVIRTTDKRERPADTYEQMKPVIEQNLQRVVYDEVLTQWKDAVEIERFDINGKPLAEKEPAAGEGEDSAAADETSAEEPVEEEKAAE